MPFSWTPVATCFVAGVRAKGFEERVPILFLILILDEMMEKLKKKKKLREILKYRKNIFFENRKELFLFWFKGFQRTI
jgi:hypothetical protein